MIACVRPVPHGLTATRRGARLVVGMSHRAPLWVAVKRGKAYMVHGYHVIIGAYGFWLPNDPRGSWSDFVGKWELVRFGRSTKSIERQQLSAEEEEGRQSAKRSLKYPPRSEAHTSELQSPRNLV